MQRRDHVADAHQHHLGPVLGSTNIDLQGFWIDLARKRLCQRTIKPVLRVFPQRTCVRFKHVPTCAEPELRPENAFTGRGEQDLFDLLFDMLKPGDAFGPVPSEIRNGKAM